jgi:Family of unknown function (DUF6011)
MAKRRNPGTGARATSTTPLADSQSKAYRYQDGYAAPTAEDRADAAILAAAAALGFRLAVRCTRCGQWLVAAESVRSCMGPVCRARVSGAAI